MSDDLLVRVVVFGDEGVGKKTLLHRLIYGAFSSSKLPNPILHKILGQNISMKIGLPFNQAIFLNLYTCELILVYDITRQSTFGRIELYRSNSRVVMLLGNKSDLHSERQVTTATGKALADSRGLLFFEVSAKDGTNVTEAFHALILKLMIKYPERVVHPPSNLEQPLPASPQIMPSSIENTPYNPSPTITQTTTTSSLTNTTPEKSLSYPKQATAPEKNLPSPKQATTPEKDPPSLKQATAKKNLPSSKQATTPNKDPPILSKSSSISQNTSFEKKDIPNEKKNSSLRGSHGVLMIPSSQIQYNPDKELGSGAQGIAYKAKWNSRDVVFKKLTGKNNTAKQSFFEELKVWRNIQHPNSISLFGAVYDSGKCGYVMEYCQNGNLSDQIANGILLNPIKMLHFVCMIANILSILHDSGIAHRDIKPANIMLDQNFHPKLGDFGLSRSLSDQQASATNLVGTPFYMAPEQFVFGAKNNPIKADVYSFGMVLYELATNQMPFCGQDASEIAQMLYQGKHPTIPQNTPIGMDENEQKIWWSIVSKCWTKDPHARPSMGEVATTLSNLHQTLKERIQGFCCRHHKTGTHDYFLSYRVATESDTVHKLFDLISQSKHPSGDALKVFLDAKCLPDAEDWQKSFLYGLHHSRIIVPVISTSGLDRFHKAHEENDNVLLEYEHMLSLLTLMKGKVEVFPLFVDGYPRALDYPDKPHITTGKNIRKTLDGILRLQGRKIKIDELEEVVPALLEKLEELDRGANTSLTVTHDTITHTEISEEELKEVFITIHGEAPRNSFVEINLSSTLSELRVAISEQLDDFDFDYKFTKLSGSRQAVLSTKQESSKTVESMVDQDSNITIQRVV